MEAQVSPQTPRSVQDLINRLTADCGNSTQIEVVSNGTSHGGSWRNYTISLVGKKQKLVSLCHSSGLEFVTIETKRSGAHVRTTIDLKANVSPQNDLQK